MNIYEALEKDHRKVEKLLDQLLESSKLEGDRWKTILEQIRQEVIPHSRAEEAVFYNTLRELDESKSLVAHSYREHAMVEAEIRALGAARMINANWTSGMEKLRNDLTHHVEEEEGKVFAAARRVLTDEEAQQLGDAFERLKIEVAKDAHSLMSNTIDLISNLLPSRFADTFKRHIGKDKTAA